MKSKNSVFRPYGPLTIVLDQNISFQYRICVLALLKQVLEVCYDQLRPYTRKRCSFIISFRFRFQYFLTPNKPVWVSAMIKVVIWEDVQLRRGWECTEDWTSFQIQFKLNSTQNGPKWFSKHWECAPCVQKMPKMYERLWLSWSLAAYVEVPPPKYWRFYKNLPIWDRFAPSVRICYFSSTPRSNLLGFDERNFRPVVCSLLQDVMLL